MNRKRITAALLALLLCASLMTACSTKPEQSEASSGNAAAVPTVTAAPTATAMPANEPAGDPTPEPPEEPAYGNVSPLPVDTGAAQEKNGFYDILCDLYQNYHTGTAGSSLTGARIAASIVDYAITNGTDAVCAGAAAFDLGETNEYGEAFADKLTAMYETAMGLYGESGRSLLADSGYTSVNYPFSAGDVREAYTAVFSARGYEVPVVVRVYRSDDTAESFLAFGMQLAGTELTADALSTVLTEPAAFNSVSVDENGHIRADVNDAFAAQVRSTGTAGEYYLVGGLVNLLLDAFDGTDVTLTVNGEPLESGHAVYDFALTRYA